MTSKTSGLKLGACLVINEDNKQYKCIFYMDGKFGQCMQDNGKLSARL